MKPNAPVEVRGEFKPIASRTPGLQLCEHFQKLSQRTDQLAVIRSLSHDDPAHLSSGHTTYTGHLPPVNKSDAEPPSSVDTPHLGSVLAHLRAPSAALPPFVMMPWKAYHPAAPGGEAPGQHAGWLGSQFDPFLITGDPSQSDWRVPALSLADGVTVDELTRKQHLLQQLDRARATLDAAAIQSNTRLKQKAFALLASPAVREAFDLEAEPEPVREQYGKNVHGQCVLLARRLSERKVPLVTVNWHNDGKYFWDTHGNNFNRLKNDLIPPADQALSALLEDLQNRGLLDETLVVWVGEFGRKPQITKNNAGREHWPYCYSGMLAGGGIAGGAVYGASDATGAYPRTNPVSPHDLMATIYHALGIPSQQTLIDVQQRPHRLYAGKPITEIFA